MIVFKKQFWNTVLSIALTFSVECVFALLFLLIYVSIYYATDYEPLNTGTPVLFVKGFLILLPSIYNIRKVIEAHKARDFFAVFGFLVISIVYCICIVFLGGGGR